MHLPTLFTVHTLGPLTPRVPHMCLTSHCQRSVQLNGTEIKIKITEVTGITECSVTFSPAAWHGGHLEEAKFQCNWDS